MKDKLWICWGVIGCISLLNVLLGFVTLAYILAFISATFGFVAFLKN